MLQPYKSKQTTTAKQPTFITKEAMQEAFSFYKKVQKDTNGQLGSLSDFITNLINKKNPVVGSDVKTSNSSSANRSYQQNRHTKPVEISKLDLIDELISGGISETNILNFDEAHLTDEMDSDVKNSEWDGSCIFRKGCMSARNWMDDSKLNIGLMLAGTASGELLPPFVMYKCQSKPGRIKESWQKDYPPPKTFYSSSSTGWFDIKGFEVWFKAVIVTWAKKLTGKKVILADNESLYTTDYILKTCERLNIHLIFLPKNWSHLTRPIDIAFCGPLKKIWKDVLSNWKKEMDNKLKRDCFPKRMKEIMSRISETDLFLAFDLSGVYPWDKDKVRKTFPGLADADEEPAPYFRSSAANNSLVLTLCFEI